ncbi:YD repeat-containing protein [Pseudoalteromonas sp. MM17-2]|uniref:RHS repeat domain-containing protein n=1 Tax=Pseudoalteromonas sp. MM17-2 TaxID=2917753 RepID=UPI001EF55E5E|nr:RHS repeat domain-containing protein [Pseudoalteromonas sp. MM17-2]MCG7545742.1 YD repeat-containing protein [Pseudoalteromonas sp. MM17-2]
MKLAGFFKLSLLFMTLLSVLQQVEAASMYARKFSWSPSTATVGQPTTFYWDVANAEYCQAHPSSSNNTRRRSSSGKSGPHIYNSVGTHRTYWFCEDADGNRKNFSAYRRVVEPVPARANRPSASSEWPVNKNITISWRATSGASKYQLYEGTKRIYSGSSRSVSISYNTFGTRSFSVRACNSGGCGQKSSTRGIKFYTAPGPVTNLSVSSGTSIVGSNVNLSWGGAGGQVNGVTYKVKVNDKLVGSTGSRSFSAKVDKIGDNTLSVTACNPNNVGCGRNTVISIRGVTPPKPSRAPVIVGGNYKPLSGAITAETSSVAGATSYKLRVRYGNTTKVQRSYSGNSVSFSSDQTGYHKVSYSACAINYCSSFGPEVQIQVYGTPRHVKNLDISSSKTAKGSKATLNWNFNGVRVGGFYRVIEQRPDGSSRTYPNIRQPVGQFDFSLTSYPLASYGLYRFKILACNDNNYCSLPKEVTTKVIPPSVSSKPVISSGLYQPVNKLFSIATNAIPEITNYKLRIMKGNLSGSNKSLVGYENIRGNSKTLSLTSTGYHFISYAACSGSVCGGFGPETRLQVYATPGVVKNLSLSKAVVDSDSTITISWNFNGTRIGGYYEVRERTPNGIYHSYPIITQKVNQFALSLKSRPLSQFGKYVFSVRACNDNSHCSAYEKAEVQVIPNSPKVAPDVLGGNYQAINKSFSVATERIKGADGYKFKVMKGPLDGSDLTAVSTSIFTGEETSLTLDSAGYYFLSYAACIQSKCSVFSPSVRVQIYDKPSRVSNLSAPLGVVDVDSEAVLRWQFNGLRVGGSYQVIEQAPDGAFKSYPPITQKVNKFSFSLRTEPLLQPGNYQFSVIACNDEFLCSEPAFTNILVESSSVKVHRFEWVPGEANIGAESTFYWDIEGVNACRAYKNGAAEEVWRAPKGDNGVHIFTEPRDYLVQWECFIDQQKTQRFPRDPSKFLTFRHVVNNKLATPWFTPEQGVVSSMSEKIAINHSIAPAIIEYAIVVDEQTCQSATDWQPYTSPIAITESTTLCAKASLDGVGESDIVSGTFEVNTGSISTVTFAYDARGRLITVKESEANAVSYRYDDAGNRISTSSPSTSSVSSSTREQERQVSSDDGLLNEATPFFNLNDTKEGNDEN